MRGDPEPCEIKSPYREENYERVVPPVDSGEIKEREADPKARVAVAARLQVEARDRDQQDCEIGLRQDAAEKGERGVGDQIEKGTEHQRGEEHLAPETTFV